MTRILISIIAVSLLICSCYDPETTETSGEEISSANDSENIDWNCYKFKNGYFDLQSELTGKNYSINRKDSIQFETEKETGKKTTWKVTWLNDCEYNLLLVGDNFGAIKSGKLKTIPSFNYKIISTTSNYYIYQTKPDLSKKFVTDTIWKAD